MSERIPILVDQVPAPVERDMVPRGVVNATLDVVIDVAADVLKERMGELVRLISEAAEASPTDGAFRVEELRFTLHVGGNGEVSVLSLAKAGIAAGAGIEVTLKKRDAV